MVLYKAEQTFYLFCGLFVKVFCIVVVATVHYNRRSKKETIRKKDNDLLFCGICQSISAYVQIIKQQHTCFGKLCFDDFFLIYHLFLMLYVITINYDLLLSSVTEEMNKIKLNPDILENVATRVHYRVFFTTWYIDSHKIHKNGVNIVSSSINQDSWL